jgi:hypothetical protein
MFTRIASRPRSVSLAPHTAIGCQPASGDEILRKSACSSASDYPSKHLRERAASHAPATDNVSMGGVMVAPRNDLVPNHIRLLQGSQAYSPFVPETQPDQWLRPMSLRFLTWQNRSLGRWTSKTFLGNHGARGEHGAYRTGRVPRRGMPPIPVHQIVHGPAKEDDASNCAILKPSPCSPCAPWYPLPPKRGFQVGRRPPPTSDRSSSSRISCTPPSPPAESARRAFSR